MSYRVPPFFNGQFLPVLGLKYKDGKFSGHPVLPMMVDTEVTTGPVEDEQPLMFIIGTNVYHVGNQGMADKNVVLPHSLQEEDGLFILHGDFWVSLGSGECAYRPGRTMVVDYIVSTIGRAIIPLTQAQYDQEVERNRRLAASA